MILKSGAPISPRLPPRRSRVVRFLVESEEPIQSKASLGVQILQQVLIYKIRAWALASDPVASGNEASQSGVTTQFGVTS